MTDQEKLDERYAAVLEGRLPPEVLSLDEANLLMERVQMAIAEKIAARRTVVHDGQAYPLQ